VTKPQGYCVLFDAVLPIHFWRRPIPWLIRKMDRGGYMRTQTEFESLFFPQKDWQFERVSYSIYGLEGVFSTITCR
jgi:hypothetical protein